MDPTKAGFFKALFDTSFNEFITPKIIRILYIIGIAFAAAATLVVIIAGFGQSVGVGVLSLVLSPLVFLLYVILMRVYLEVLIVLFKIAENTRRY